MRVVAIIQARMGSRRFPGKVLADLCGKPVLQHVVEAVQRTQSVDDVVVAVPWGDQFTLGGHAPTFLGREQDVLSRIAIAALEIGADLVVRVCGDNPLISPVLIDQLVLVAKETAADYVGFEFAPGEPAIRKPNGYIAEVVKFRALSAIYGCPYLSASDREHVTQFIYDNPQYFNLVWLPLPEPYRFLPSASIDTPTDLRRVTRIVREREGLLTRAFSSDADGRHPSAEERDRVRRWIDENPWAYDQQWERERQPVPFCRQRPYVDE